MRRYKQKIINDIKLVYRLDNPGVRFRMIRFVHSASGRQLRNWWSHMQDFYMKPPMYIIDPDFDFNLDARPGFSVYPIVDTDVSA